MKKLSFIFGNAKLSNSIATFSLPAGWTCPFARECLAKADRITGCVTDGPYCRYRCFAATQEWYPTVKKTRWGNFELLQETGSLEEMANLIQRSLPFGVNLVRMHVSGDFFSERYFLAWLNVALNNPLTIFYGYTKALLFWIKYKKEMPSNFRLTASYGGTHDSLISKHRLKYSVVVFSIEEAQRKRLELDHDDSHAIRYEKPFALLLHGTQPAKTDAARAWYWLYKAGHGYSEEKKARQMERPTPIRVPPKGVSFVVPGLCHIALAPYRGKVWSFGEKSLTNSVNVV